MPGKSFTKDLYRSIFKSRARFLSIMAIITLGVGFFAGINATEPDMILSADQYYREHNLADFHLISPLGFKDEDIVNVRKTTGVAAVQEAYTKDVFLTSTAGTTSTVRLYSYDPADSTGQPGISTPEVIEGRLPERIGEMAIETGNHVPDEIRIGSRVTLSVPTDDELRDSLKTGTFIVVGRISSPMYITFERGQTNIGDGSVGFFAYIAKTSFAMDKITDLFVRTKSSPALAAYSAAYKDHLVPIQDAFEKLGKDAIGAETQKLRDELEKGKAELQLNKDKAERELADGEQKLLDAEKKITDGEQKLSANETKYTQELADKKTLLETGRSELNQGKTTYFENYKKWLDGYAAYVDGQARLNESSQKLDAAKAQIDQGENELAASKSQLDSAKSQLDGLAQMIQALKAVRDNLPPDGTALTQAEFDQVIAAISTISPELAGGLSLSILYDDPYAVTKIRGTLDQQINSLEQTLSVQMQQYNGGLDQYNAGADKIADARQQYEDGLASYQDGLDQLNASKAELDNGKAQLDAAKVTIDENEKKLITGEAALPKGEVDLQAELAKARRELADGRLKLNEGRATYETEKADALQKIADAEVKIRDAGQKILEIPDEWYVLTRDGNPGYAGYGEDARRVGSVAKVFPLFFFLVAALVCLTTMTRMVEEQRIQIGTLKALGYSTLTISSKYLIYALAASLSGALIGLAIGFRLFPGVIMNAYGMMYQIPNRLTPDHALYAAISIFIAVVTTVAATLMAILSELRAHPAVLMQPKAPKPGKRILLERIQPIWKRLSFSHKVTARNLFRYKRRLLMTVIGIAGCTALLVTGFGLRDSINAIMGKQFDEIFIYDGLMVVDTEKDAAQRDTAQILGKNAQVTAYLDVLNETVSGLVPDSSRSYEVNLIVPSDTTAFKNFYDLHERVSRQKIDLPAEGAVISEKLASLLDVKKGGTITYRDSENRTYTVTVTAITENYLTHYLYMSPQAFDKLTYRTPVYNTAVFNLKDAAGIDRKAFKEYLLSYDGVLGAVFTLSMAEEFTKTINSLNVVVLVLILSAGALAFVVLYNLTNINITERIREIATIKVLGFRDKEVSAYVYRENMILTIIGTLAGLVLGFALHRFVMGTMEIDTMMFGKDIKWLSYVMSIALTMTFSIIVNIFMFYHLKKVNMVESLKSIE